MNTLPKVNYDAVAPAYDERVQGTYLLGVSAALQQLVGQVQPGRVLDLGCGTGRSLQGLETKLERFGLDLSSGMLGQARRLDPTYRLVRAAAFRPPFAKASFDLVYCVHAFHHFSDKQQVIQAAYDLLRPGGIFAIINFDPREADQSWPIYDYFDDTYATDLSRFPAMAEQESWLRAVGFQQVSSPVIQYIDHEIRGEAIFEDYHLRKESCSQLILLSNEAYQTGLDRMRERINRAKASGETIVFRTTLKNRMCHGFKR